MTYHPPSEDLVLILNRFGISVRSRVVPHSNHVHVSGTNSSPKIVIRKWKSNKIEKHLPESRENAKRPKYRIMVRYTYQSTSRGKSLLVGTAHIKWTTVVFPSISLFGGIVVKQEGESR